MTAAQAQALVERIRDSGLLMADEWVTGCRDYTTDQWQVELWRESPQRPYTILTSFEGWTALATERGASGVGSMYAKG